MESQPDQLEGSEENIQFVSLQEAIESPEIPHFSCTVVQAVDTREFYHVNSVEHDPTFKRREGVDTVLNTLDDNSAMIAVNRLLGEEDIAFTIAYNRDGTLHEVPLHKNFMPEYVTRQSERPEQSILTTEGWSRVADELHQLGLEVKDVDHATAEKIRLGFAALQEAGVGSSRLLPTETAGSES